MDSTQIGNSAEQNSSMSDSLELVKQEQTLHNYEDIFKQQQEQINFLTQELERLKNPAAKSKPSQKRGSILKRIWRSFTQYLAGIHGSATYQPRFSVTQILVSYLGSFFGIGALAYLSIASGYPVIAAPFGAAAVLVFAVPNSPLAQPRNLIFGNLIGGIVSVLMVTLFGSEPWVMALSVATAIKVMQLTKTLHPPGGAVALVGVLSKATWGFILTPVLAGSIILLFCTFAFNNLMPERSYPRHWL
ncbi:HPP family protein [Hyella patelloides LEGE 07179]|uniref:HPP family protein n=1 Tax=Hyella patelloides LEGE 07179 TaxID=945734 RepID=A0A563VL97_9CYAN|nr:HPP family protein [Hyella patelloides]VEP12209.1 HPP family protein [Hyella patelloides LEGE 07179]